jgi:hypothetical protein
MPPPTMRRIRRSPTSVPWPGATKLSSVERRAALVDGVS